MRKSISILTICAIMLFTSFSALSEDIAKIMPTETANSYSFQRDYDAIERATNSIFYVEIFDHNSDYIGSASGFVVFREHLFVTNYHVIEDACFIKIWDEKDNSYILDKIVAVDKSNDLAILAFPDGEKYESLDFQLDADLKRGQPVTTIGSPQGIQNTVAFGNISAFPIIEDVKMIQFTAPISHGSSGGVLFDDNGKVIGITTSVLTEGENIGFAVPINNLIHLYQQWDKKSYVILCSPTPKPTVTPTPKPTKSPIPTSTPKANYPKTLEELRKEIINRIVEETNVTAYIEYNANAQWVEKENDTISIRFQISNYDCGRTIEAFELYIYATDVWDNQIYGKNNVYYWTTTKNIMPGKTVYSDYITIPNRSRIYRVFCGIHKVRYSDGIIQTVDNVEYSSWQIK